MQRRAGAELVAGKLAIDVDAVGGEGGDGEIPLKSHLRRQHLAPDADQHRNRERPLMPGQQAPEDARLAPRPERQRHGLGAALQRADLGDDVGAAHQKVVNLVVDAIDLVAQVFERLVLGHFGQISSINSFFYFC